MSEILNLENIALSVLANGIALLAARLMKSAPPRLVLCFCLVGMLAILFPWSMIGIGLGSYLPVVVSTPIDLPILVGTGDTAQLSQSQIGRYVFALWLAVGIGWIGTTFLRHLQTMKSWRSSAIPGQALGKCGDPVFASELRRSTIFRLPNSSLVFSSGLLRPEIWVGDAIKEDAHLRAAMNHELSHIASNDQITLFVVVVMERLMWWNPLMWLLGREIRCQMEYACDMRCQSLLGAEQYRKTLAELLLGDNTRKAPLQIGFGKGSDIINRMEKIGVNHSLKPRHLITLALGCTLMGAASSNLAAQDPVDSTTLIDCHDLLPDEVQYRFEITSAIDTRKGESTELNLTLSDAQSNSTDIPAGAEEFLRCVQKVVGIGNDEGWPGT